MWMQDNRYADMVLQRLLVTPRDEMAWVGAPKTAAAAATTTRPKRGGKAKRRNKGKQKGKGVADKGGAAEGKQEL